MVTESSIFIPSHWPLTGETREARETSDDASTRVVEKAFILDTIKG